LSSQQLVYIDTNVFSFLLLPHKQSQDQFVKQANKFIDEIENGTYIGITSTLTEIEYRGTSKRIISEVKKGLVTAQEEESAMDDFDHFVDTLGIGLVDADQVAPEISGELRLFSLCGKTVRRSHPVHMAKNQWKMIRSVDTLMINLAIRIRADLFATFDNGFKGYKDSLIAPLILSDEYRL
jgi:predicted nucleic acid-binding protein